MSMATSSILGGAAIALLRLAVQRERAAGPGQFDLQLFAGALLHSSMDRHLMEC